MAVIPWYDRSPAIPAGTVTTKTADLLKIAPPPRRRRWSATCCVPIRVDKEDGERILASTPPLADRLLDACSPDSDLIPDGIGGAGDPCRTIAGLWEARTCVVLLILGEKPSAEVAAVKDRTRAGPRGNTAGVDLCNVQVLHRVEEVGYHAG